MYGPQHESKRYSHGQHLEPQDADPERRRIGQRRNHLEKKERRYPPPETGRGYRSDNEPRRQHRHNGDRDQHRASSSHRAKKDDQYRQVLTNDSEDALVLDLREESGYSKAVAYGEHRFDEQRSEDALVQRERMENFQSDRMAYGEHHFDDYLHNLFFPPPDPTTAGIDPPPDIDNVSRPSRYGDHRENYLERSARHSRRDEEIAVPLRYRGHRSSRDSLAAASWTTSGATAPYNDSNTRDVDRDDGSSHFKPLNPAFSTPPYQKDHQKSMPDIITPDDSRSETDGNMQRLQTSSGASSTHLRALSSSLSVASSSLLGPNVYQYRPLQEAEIRLVKILPERMWKLKCEIIHVSLIDPPGYSAISYAWGDGVDTKSLLLEGVKIPVAASLHEALMAVRRKKEAILVWIDALCINQQDKDERASQVRLMGQIYSSAASIAIWIGPVYEESALAMQLLEKVAEGSVGREYIRSTRNSDSLALFNLFKRGYWKRLWVVQEVLLARNKTVYCGDSNHPWEVYQTAADIFWDKGSDPHIRQGPSSFPDRNTLRQLGDESLLEVLRVCRKKLSENPRDKVFGILGLLSEETQRDFPVDYSQSVKAVYTDVVDHLVSTTDSLDVIREAIHFPLHVNSTDLPSWCPDWSHIPEVSGLGRTLGFAASRNANGSTKARYWFYDERRKLEISAIRIDSVMATGVAVGTFCAAQDYLTAFLQWRAVLLHELSIEDGDESHPMHKAFCRTLCLGQVPPEWSQPEAWRDLCYHVFAALTRERMPRMPISEDLKRYADATGLLEPRLRRKFLQDHFGNRMMGRSLCITEGGLVGMGSGYMTAKDVVVVPFGCSTPILLRPEGSGNKYRYVGDVYIDGYMHGEAVAQMEAKDAKRVVSKFMLC